MHRNSLSLIVQAAFIACCLTTVVEASPIDDGNQGLIALDGHDYDKAIRLFSRALASGQLKGDDQEFAYLNRGKAYLAQGNRTAASADLRHAVQLRPDDSEAKAALNEAQASAANARSEPPLARWGILASMADRIWMHTVKKRTVYERIQWTSDHKSILANEVYSSGQRSTTRIILDPAAGLIFGQVAGRLVVYGVIDINGNQLVESGEVNGTPVRSTINMSDMNSLAVTDEVYKGGAWTMLDNYTASEVTPEQVQAIPWARRLVQ